MPSTCAFPLNFSCAKVFAWCGDNMRGTHFLLMLVVFVVMCVKFGCGDDDLTTEERFPSTSPEDYVDETSTYTTVEETSTYTTVEDTTTQSPCQSVPEELTNLMIYKENGVSIAKWPPSANKECNRYKVSVNGKHRIVTENYATLGDVRCTKVEIAAMDSANNTGEAITRLVPGEIQNLVATTPETFMMNLSWEPPKDDSCVINYVIYFNDEKYETKETTFTLSGLKACTAYDGEVAAASETSEGMKTSFSKKTSTPTTTTEKETVTNLMLEPSLSTMTVSWDLPEKTGACVDRYMMTIWDQNNQPTTINTNDLIYIIDPIVPCMQYNAQVTPILINEVYGMESRETQNAQEQATLPPTDQGIIWNQDDVTVTVKVAEYSINMCKISKVDVSCKYAGSDLLWWMTPEGSTSHLYSDSGSSRPPVTISVEELSPYTDYECSITVENTGGVSQPKTFSGKTMEDVPNKPDNFSYEEGTEAGINFFWDIPTKIPGIFGNFRVNITHSKINHFTPESCAIRPINVNGHEQLENSYLFESSLANSQYWATVEASTSAGFGEASTLEFNSLPRASEVVRNLKVGFTNIEGEVYDVTARITWFIPCNTNGELTKFVFEIKGKSVENASDVFDEIKEVDVNKDIKDEEYELDIPNIKPLFDYELNVYAITSHNGNEIKGLMESIEFSSPDGYPSAPTNLEVGDITSTSATIEWKEPANKNGEIISYEITIHTIKPLYPINDLNCNIDYTPHIAEVDGDVFHYQNDDLLPYFEYKVIVRANTSAGFGKGIEYTFQTLDSQPDIISAASVEQNITPIEEYDNTINVNFALPCHINGAFKHVQVTLQGTRNGFPDDLPSPLIVNDINSDVTDAAPLKPAYTYGVFLEVYTTNYVSDKYIVKPFTSFAGVPESAMEPLKTPEVIDSFTAKFQLNQETFTDTMGEIIYFAIILAPADFELGKDFGFINNDEWPSIGYWSNVSELMEYQTTPEKWNPFNSKVFTGKQASLYSFTIGEEICDNPSGEYCNGPLRPDTQYSLRVRGFTSFGYRDTPIITFWTPAQKNYAALIGGITGGAIALLLILIILLVFWRRRRKQKYVDDTDMDMLSLVPVPVPINNFVAHYTDYKNNLNKLKAEFSLLEKNSSAEQSPTTFALTDDNKKKNRYINVLPYDETRVKLDRDKNDNYTDYINASFIKGYSGNIEYIATQGPLESTVVDYWRMVIQENVSVIVMVAQFVEQEKAKCHQYIPNNHETMNIGDGIEIRCANEIPLGGYIKRTLMVQRELMQLTITHLQYIEWPDFGCPNNTESMLEFCSTFRVCAEQHKSKTIIHCSAGVGRTGTLIALDILFQTIENKGDIDVFGTVMNLRKQRTRMVQTEKQYMFIHSCLAEYISNPKKEKQSQELEPIYENVKHKKTDNEVSVKDIP